MLGKRSRPASRKSPEPIITISGGGGGEQLLLSPASPLERDPRSPKGWKNRESGGVGLGIVAALSAGAGEFPAATKVALGSSPISIVSPRTADKVRCFLEGFAAGERKKTGERKEGVFGDGVRKGGVFGDGGGKDGEERWRRELGFFCASPPPRLAGDSRFFPTVDFLSSCYLCGKKLHGEDIYMYRGEKAFCSMECRYRQIVNDECQERCGSKATTADYSAVAVAGGGQLFCAGIAAA